jgi:hypothetical protein
MSLPGLFWKSAEINGMSASASIVLQKSKVAGLRILRKIRSEKQSPIRTGQIALPKSPMSFPWRDEALKSLHENRPAALRIFEQ